VDIPRCGLRDRHHEAAVLHAFQSNEAPSELLNLPGFSADNEDFQAGVMIEMRVTGRNHQLVIRVLNFGQLLRHPMGVMVVDECDCADYDCIRSSRLLYDQAIANQIAESFRPVGISQPGDELVEAFEKIGIECNSDSAKDTHRHSLEVNRLSVENSENSTITRFVSRLSLL
jgi:hypothetical protein